MTVGDDFFWERLLQDMESGLVVPIVGRDLLSVSGPDGRSIPYHRLVATRLADSLGVPTGSLPEAFDTNDVICAFQGFHGNPGTYLPRVVSVVKSLQVEPPAALRLLAEIPTLRLFVSTTYDSLLEEALARARAQPPKVLSFPASSHETDFDEQLLDQHGSMVFHMLGRCAGSAVFSVTEGQTLELMHQLLAGDRRPNRLLDRLRDSHLLLLGVGFPDWLSRFLLRVSRSKPLWDSRDRNEVIAESIARGEDLPRFLDRFSPEHSHTFSGGTLEDFVTELHRRWFERFPASGLAEEASPTVDLLIDVADPSEPEKMARGSVFISYAREDRESAFRLADSLNEYGVETWVDRRLHPGDDYRDVIERHIREACAFVPVLSRSTQAAGQRWFRREWALAVDRSAMNFGTDQSFLFPVIVDDAPKAEFDDTVNRIFRRTVIGAPGGEAPESLTLQLLRAQRAWRKQFGARL